nr:MAG TPA: hypothetical protein [Caudoviricetes sp.]
MSSRKANANAYMGLYCNKEKEKPRQRGRG